MDIEATKTKRTIDVVDKVTFTLTLAEARDLLEDINHPTGYGYDQDDRTQVTKNIAEKLRPFCG